MKAVYRTHVECLAYFQELMKIKTDQLAVGEEDYDTMDLMGKSPDLHGS
jgi:hypothetical protein